MTDLRFKWFDPLEGFCNMLDDNTPMLLLRGPECVKPYGIRFLVWSMTDSEAWYIYHSNCLGHSVLRSLPFNGCRELYIKSVTGRCKSKENTRTVPVYGLEDSNAFGENLHTLVTKNGNIITEMHTDKAVVLFSNANNTIFTINKHPISVFKKDNVDYSIVMDTYHLRVINEKYDSKEESDFSQWLEKIRKRTKSNGVCLKWGDK